LNSQQEQNMTTTVESLSFLERFQQPVTRRSVFIAAGATLLAVLPAFAPRFLKNILQLEDRLPKPAPAQPLSKQEARLAARQRALAYRYSTRR
jgi:hypothetical protein